VKRWSAVILVSIAAGLIAVAIAATSVSRFLHTPATIPESGSSFEIAQGSAFATVAADLAAEGIIAKADLLRWYARFSGEASEVHAGQYRLVPGDTPRTILDKFIAGQVELYSFTIIEGWNYRELLAALASSEFIQSSVALEDWPAVLESIGAAEDHPEGLFLPETYRIAKGTQDVDVLKQAYELMQKTLHAEWQDRDENLPVSTPYEALILGSIIEKETARADERAQISGVFVRRLQKRMRLQTDPTVIYGVGEDYAGNITRRHLQTDTPYNTYTRHGLPPTPIAMPGRAAINAALHPAAGSDLYFVATGLGDGSHKFSETKAEHDAAVREYLARQRGQ